MRKLLSSIIALSIILISFARTNDTDIATPPPVTDSAAIYLNEYYILERGRTPSSLIYTKIHLKRDFTFEDTEEPEDTFFNGQITCTRNGKKILGDWRVSGDSLFLYFHYFQPEDTSMTNLLTAISTPEELSDSDYVHGIYEWSGERYIPSSYLPDKILPKYYPFAKNELVFKIKHFGQELIPLSLERMHGYYISKPMYRSNRHIDQINSEAGWEKVRIDWQAGSFRVSDKQNFNGHTQLVHLVKDGIKFIVVNPKYYLPDTDCRLYTPKDLPALSDWMDSVKINDTLKFVLSRPAYCIDYDDPGAITYSLSDRAVGYYDANSAYYFKLERPDVRIPADRIITYNRLKSIPDSLWISRGGYPHEAYGDFFARPTHQHNRPQ